MHVVIMAIKEGAGNAIFVVIVQPRSPRQVKEGQNHERWGVQRNNQSRDKVSQVPIDDNLQSLLELATCTPFMC